jgi:hypothetical protein
MTGMGALPAGGFSIIPGSTPFGGQITPLDSESRSLSGARSVVSPERGGGATSGGQSRWIDGGVGPSFWAYSGEVEIAARIAAATAVFFKLCMVILRSCFSRERTNKNAGQLRLPSVVKVKPSRVTRLGSLGGLDCCISAALVGPEHTWDSHRTTGPHNNSYGTQSRSLNRAGLRKWPQTGAAASPQ